MEQASGVPGCRATSDTPVPQSGEGVGEPADGGPVGPSVVVDDDDHGPVDTLGDALQRLPGHAAGQCPVPDDRDDPSVGLPGDGERLGQTVSVGQGRRPVGGLRPVVRTLVTGRVARQSVTLPQGVEEVAASGDDLVDVGLVAGVEDDRVRR